MPRNYFPVFSSDVNGPWHREEVDGVLTAFHLSSVDDSEHIESLRSGEIKVGDTIIEFYPNEEPGKRGDHEYGYGSLYRLVGWRDGGDHVHIWVDKLDQEG